MDKILKIKKIIYNDMRGGVNKFYQSSSDFDFGKIEQIFISDTLLRNTVRGIHFQYGKDSEKKLIYCINGNATWFAIDLRSGVNFNKVELLSLDSKNDFGYYIPDGFGHGMISNSNNVRLFIVASKSFNESAGVNLNIYDPSIPKIILNTLPKNIIYEDSKKFISFSELINSKTIPLP